MSKPRKAVIYARVSSEKQGRDSAVSIDEQVSACLAAIQARGDRHIATFIDDKRYQAASSGRMVEPSAKRVDRPDWLRMLAGAGKEWDVLYAWRTDRICRGNESAGMFERYLDERRFAVELVTSVFDRDSFGLLAGGVGGFELRNIAVRMNMGREGRVKAGKHTGRIPYGYRVVRDDQGRSVGYELTAEGRLFLNRLAALFLDRVSLTEIGRRLAPSRSGGPWQVFTVKQFLTSEFYRGQLVYGKNRPNGHAIVAAGLHPPAWDAATIAAIDAEWKRRERAGHFPRLTKRSCLFRGVLRCAYCGRVLNACGGEQRGVYYPAYRCLSPLHPTNSISELKVVAYLKELLGGVTVAEIDAILDAEQPAVGPALGTAATQAGIDQDEAKAADLLAALERVRGISPEATRLLEQELADTQARLAHRQRELSDAERAAAQYHRAELRAAAIDLAATLDSLDNPDLEVRATTARLISRAFPAFTVKHGQILP